MIELYAHTPNDKVEWHSFESHLKEVAELAGKFADKFGVKELAKWIGLWHDIGKNNSKFQDYLKACGIRERIYSSNFNPIEFERFKNGGSWLSAEFKLYLVKEF